MGHPPRADRDLALAALAKQQRGERPSAAERAALARIEQARDDQQRLEHYRTIRKREWCQWSGRQVKTINEQAERYRAPLGGPTISLPEVARWLHDFLAENARKLAGSDDEAFAGATSAALERQRLARAKREEFALERDLGRWIARSALREGHARIAGVLRLAGESLLRQFGAAAQKILNDALDDAQREVDRLLADPDGTQPS